MIKIKKPEWLVKKQEALRRQRKKQLKDQGLEEFFKIPQGETIILFNLDVEPREREGDFGMQHIFRVRVNEVVYDLSASLSLSRRIYDALSEGKNPMTIIRAGEGRQTRYSIKELIKT